MQFRESRGRQTSWIAQCPQYAADKIILTGRRVRVSHGVFGYEPLLATRSIALGISPGARGPVQVDMTPMFPIEDGCDVSRAHSFARMSSLPFE